ncbi:MAG TPA: DNA-binding transcriptional regulator [Opitutaceae bacterium]|nr:DNA-binding transcriptional regulator [Opitutaceae bacterium]
MRPQVLLVFLTRFEESMAMLKGVVHYERTHQIWAAFHDDQARAETEPHWLRDKKWHGVISRHTTPGLVQVCAELKIPLVDLNDIPIYPGVPKIRPDNVGLGHLGAEHFLERGHRHFGFSGFSNYEWSCERRDGFIEALKLAGRECDVFDVTYPGDLTPVWDVAQISMLASWLKRLPKPVGVMGCMDLRAQQIISAAQDSGILIPEEVAVLGVNNDPIRCELAYPPLSSVAPNAFQSGYRAAEVLADMLAGRKVKDLDQRIEPIGVITRPSSDVLAIDDRNLATALSFIREKACHGITVDEVVRHAFASRSQLEKKFRRHVGRSPQAEIRRVQVAKIRQLLFETDFPLKKIAELTGFEHVEYMCVLFKRLNGESPGVYRKKMQATGGV